MFPGQCGNTAFFFKSQPDQFHFEFRGIVFPGKSFFSAHEVSTCKISGCLSYRILDSGPDGTQTTLTNGFGFGLVDPSNVNSVTRTLSSRYMKDGSEILIDRGWSHELGETDFHNTYNMDRRPRMLTPRECSRLMGFDKPGESVFRIPVSNTQAYRQFGNSVVVDVFAAVAKLLKSRIEFAASQRLRQFYDEVS